MPPPSLAVAFPLIVPKAASRTPVPQRESESTADGSALDPLLEACARGDLAAQEKLFREVRPTVFRHVAFLLRTRGEIEDVVQEVFIELLRSLKSFQGRSRFETWLHSITVRVTYRQLRRQWRSPPPPQLAYEFSQVGDRRSADDDLAVRERHQRTLAILTRLSPKKRMVLVLHDLEGIPAAEIAALVGAPLLTVRTRLFYARHEFTAAARRDPLLAEFFDGKEQGEEREELP